MLTKNWDKVILTWVTNSSIKATNVLGNSFGLSLFANPLQIAATSNAVYYPRMANVVKSYDGNGGVIFGNGTTPPTRDDYCLSGDVISTVTSTANGGFTTDADGATGTYTYTLTNTGTADITIGEVGLIAGGHSTSSRTAPDYKCLLERSVLDEPVTIPAGGVGQVTYTIRMNYPTA
jgi:hypothetical protein